VYSEKLALCIPSDTGLPPEFVTFAWKLSWRGTEGVPANAVSTTRLRIAANNADPIAILLILHLS
jgi:hypothetical protein